MGTDRYFNVRESNTSEFIAIVIYSAHEGRVEFTFLSWIVGDAYGLFRAHIDGSNKR